MRSPLDLTVCHSRKLASKAWVDISEQLVACSIVGNCFVNQQVHVDLYLKATRRVCPRAGVSVLGQYLQGEAVSVVPKFRGGNIQQRNYPMTPGIILFFLFSYKLRCLLMRFYLCFPQDYPHLTKLSSHSSSRSS